MITTILLQALWYALILAIGLFTVGCLWAVWIVFAFDRSKRKGLE